MKLLEVEGLRCSVKPTLQRSFRTEKKIILNSVSIGIEECETVGLLGASGSGKSTLARCIVGLQQPDAGTIFYRGINIFPESRNRRLIPLDLQMLFQASGASLDPLMTVQECLEEGIAAARRTGNDNAHAATVENLLSSVGLSIELRERFPSQLSGGQRQRVAIARALAAHPTLLILDEPTSALDSITGAAILSLLKKLQAERRFSLLLITHDVRTAFMLCNRIAILHEGRIVEEGTSTTVLQSPRHSYTRQLLSDSRINS
jgi:ABC-type glutathione transport system ATPase component